MSITLPETPTISVEEAAKVLGISRASGYRLAADGSLPVVRCGKRSLRVPTAAFLAKFNLA